MEININISNYEEFLLSAVDGELNGDEMVALEAFLQQHPHIREELALLESVRLMPDPELLFDNKAQLYRSANYETQLLDYIDNELNSADKQAFELLIQQDSRLQKELNILQQTRLQPDLSLRFEDKAVLYRSNRTKVRPIWWWSAAAAVVAGVAVVLFAPSQSEKHNQIAANQSVVKKQADVQQQTASEKQTEAEEQTVNTPSAIAETTIDKQKTSEDQTVNTPSAIAKTITGTQKTSDNSGNTTNKQTVNGSRKLLAGINNSNTAEPSKNETDKQPPATDNGNIALGKLAQPAATSAEIVEQLQNKINDEQIAATEKAPVLANANTINKVSEAVKAPAPVQGELVVSVTMNGDSKLLNGVANVARFFSKKKK